MHSNHRLFQTAAYLQSMQAAANAARASYPVEGADQVGAMGAWGGFDVLGGNREVGSAGLLDVVGDGVATFAKPLTAGRASLASLAGVQAVNPEHVMDAAAVLQRPVGLPPNSTWVADGPRVARKQYVGLGSRVALGGGAAVTIQAQPQSVARIERLIIESIGSPTASGRDFVVTRLDIGDMRQISGTGEIPGTAFSAEGFQLDVKLDTSNPGNVIAITIENVTAGAVVIAVIGIGTVVR